MTTIAPIATPPQDAVDADRLASPRDEYLRRLDARKATAGRLEARSRRFADARLGLFVLALVLAGLAYAGKSSWAWLGLPLAGFVGLVLAHDRVDRDKRRAIRAVGFYEHGLARLDGTWPGKGTPGERFADEEHPYASDLDLFGRGSLFELLNTARTRAGEDTLASWLKRPADPATIRERQAAVAELRPRLDLREEVALIGDDVRAGADPKAMTDWGGHPPSLSSTPAWWTARILGTAGFLLLVGWLLEIVPPGIFLLVLILEVIFSIIYGKRVRAVAGSVARAGHDLTVLAGLLERIEREAFHSPTLARIRTALDATGVPASRRIARLGRFIGRLESAKNPIFAPFSWAMLWTTRTAFAIDAWRAESGPAIAGWLAAAGEFEALCSLASLSYEHPDDPFAEVVADASPFVDGEGLGHPLLPADRCVRNDASLGGEAPRMLLVSGSNMSGKSTMLRTIGTNLVLAQAGASVRARRLRLSPLMPGGTLGVHDSLLAGKSRFFAEVARLKQLIDLASEEPPLLFLLDEILHGTNSHDRRIGAEAVIRKLLDLGAIGLTTTHDLSLTEIAGTTEPRAVNVHFEDDFQDGQMTFDYTMRPGVVARSNALAVMRSVGIDV